MAEHRDLQAFFGNMSFGQMLTSSSIANGYNYGGWSVTNFTPTRTLKGDDTLANVTKVLCTLINDMVTKSNPS